MNNDKKKNYYKHNNNYYNHHNKNKDNLKKEAAVNKNEMVPKKITYDSLVNGEDGVISVIKENVSNDDNRMLRVKYICTLVILVVIVLASLLFFHIL